MTTQNKDLYGLILAGGYSKRMGQDKALMDFHGKPQAVYCYELLSTYCDKVFVSTRPDQRFLDLPLLMDLDQFLNKGPIAGILSAMQTYPQVSWVLLACDLPYVRHETIDHLLKNRAIHKAATAFISSRDGMPEPLCAVWESCSQKGVLEYYEQGIQCPRKILIKSDVNLLTLPDHKWLNNVNSPEDLKRYLKETFS